MKGKQRYRCKVRGKNQIPGDGRVRYSNKIRYLALAMHLNSADLRSIGRVLGVPFQLVHHWVHKAGERAEGKAAQRANSSKEIAILEMGEMYSYIQKKRLENPSMACC